MKLFKYFEKFSKKSKITYFSIGLIVFILIGWSIGLTRFVMVYLSMNQESNVYVKTVNKILISKNDDIYLCVIGNILKLNDEEFWVVIPAKEYMHNVDYEKKFNDVIYNKNNFGISTIPNSEIIIEKCNSHPEVELNRLDVSYKNINGNEHDETQKLVDRYIESENKSKIILMNYKKNNSTMASKFIYVWYSDEYERFTMWFWTESTGYNNKLNQLWYLLYVPSILIDILLWPIWLLIFMSFVGRRPI